MRSSHTFLALPASLLLLLLSNTTPAVAANEDQSPAEWPYETPPHVKNSPEDLIQRRWDLEAIQDHILAGHKPVVMRKMSEDESEMFFPEYWGFHDQADQFPMSSHRPREEVTGPRLRKEFEEDDRLLLANSSAILSFRPAFPVHAIHETPMNQDDPLTLAKRGVRWWKRSAMARALLENRQFACVPGTTLCSNSPSLCCAAGETCVTVTDSGIGSIGCCPNDATCAGTIDCVAPNTPCGTDIGGGCCIPGFVCGGIGCVPSAPATVASTMTQTLSSSTAVVVVTSIVTPIPSTITSTKISTLSTVSVKTTTTSTSTTRQTSTIAPSSTTTTATTTATPDAPFRPTSASETIGPTAAPTPTPTDASCPLSFYACSAYYPGGGCCRIGRDCATTDCPSTASTTLISSGVTIVVPLVASATTTATGSCMTGWYNCGPDEGGSCCPSGWSCGTESCTSVGPSGTGTEPKEGVILGGAGRTNAGGIHWSLSLAMFIMVFLALVA